VIRPGFQSDMYTAWVGGTDDGAHVFDLLESISINAHVSEDGTLLETD